MVSNFRDTFGNLSEFNLNWQMKLYRFLEISQVMSHTIKAGI